MLAPWAMSFLFCLWREGQIGTQRPARCTVSQDEDRRGKHREGLLWQTHHQHAPTRLGQSDCVLCCKQFRREHRTGIYCAF